MAKKASEVSSGTKSSKTKVDYNAFVAEVQKKAYEIYQERINTQKSGDSVSDWVKAEKELKKKYAV